MKPEPDTLMPLNNSNTLKTIIQKAVLEVFKLFKLRWINIKIKMEILSQNLSRICGIKLSWVMSGATSIQSHFKIRLIFVSRLGI